MRKLSLLIVLVLLSSCAVKPPDVPICVELDMDRGWCTNTLSSDEFYVDNEHPFFAPDKDAEAMNWWEMRPYMLLVPYSSWVEIKTFILKMCKVSGKCSENITNWERSVEGLDDKLDEKLPDAPLP